MAGSQDPNDNPVAINVVPMVDVIFCLCVFFMCSFKFKELEGKFESWLPKDQGSDPVPQDTILQEIRVAVIWYEQEKKVKLHFGNRVLQKVEDLQPLIKEAYAEAVKLSKPDTPVIIDGDSRAPWNSIVEVMNVAKHEGINKIQFAFGKDWSKESK